MCLILYSCFILFFFGFSYSICAFENFLVSCHVGFLAERVRVKVVECACVIELLELKVMFQSQISMSLVYSNLEADFQLLLYVSIIINVVRLAF